MNQPAPQPQREPGEPREPPWPWWQRDASSTPARPVWRRADGAPEGFRPVDPPRWVWVDLRAALRKDAFTFTDDNPTGLQYRYEAKGLLRAWMPSVDGAALALVTYQLLTADLAWRTTVTAFVPAHSVRFRSRTGRESR